VTKASLLVMLLFTVLLSFGLRWREGRLPGGAPARRRGLFARGKAGLDRWVTAAAIAAVLTIALMGGLHWLRVLSG